MNCSDCNGVGYIIFNEMRGDQMIEVPVVCDCQNPKGERGTPAMDASDPPTEE